MTKKSKSMRGVIVDWDLAQVKSQMEQSPAPLNVEKRQNFIDQKLRRRVKKVKEAIHNLEASSVDRKVAEPPVAQAEKIDEVVAEEVVEKPKRTVKRKPKAKAEIEKT